MKRRKKFCRRKGRRVLLALLFFLAGTTMILAQVRTYNTARWMGGELPEIDGQLTETGWSAAPWQNEFIQRVPYEGQMASQRTAFKILYDDENLYVAIRAFDNEPEKIERRLARRDNQEGDYVAVAIDSYYDRLTAFSFGVNAAGVKTDMMISNDIEEDNTWNPVWWVKVNLDSLGWIAEMKIPYSQLRFASKEDHVWGLQVMRWIHREEEFSVWQFVPVDVNAWVSRYGNLEGISGIKPKKEVELIPYAMGSIDTYQKDGEDPFKKGRDFRYSAGVDGKVAVTNDLTLNFTVNPDFGQVEADPSEVNLTAFETFFPEKRPFFIEGNNIFDFSATIGNGHLSRDNLFYSRRIGRVPHHEPDLGSEEYMDCPESTPILGAFKLSGKTRKGWSIGVMDAFTNKVAATVDSEGTRRDELIEPYTNYFNARVQKDINKGRTVLGGMFTSTNRFMDSEVCWAPRSAYTQGLDFEQYWKDKTYHLRAKVITSQVYGSTAAITELQEAPQRFYQRPDADYLGVDTTLTVLKGHGGSISGGKLGGGRFRYMGYITWRSPGLELNDQGYLRQADIVQQVGWAQYRVWEPKGIYRSFNVTVNQWTGWDFGGDLNYYGLSFNGQMQFKNYWTIGMGSGRDASWINRAELRGGPAIRMPGDWNYWYWMSTDERKKMVLSVMGFSNWGGHANSRFIELGPELSWRPVKALSIAMQPVYRKGYRTMQYIETTDYNGEDRFIMGRIDQNMAVLNLRVNLSITPDLSIQYWGQPFVFAGDYSEFKTIDEPMSHDFYKTHYLYDEDQLSFNADDDMYAVDENKDGRIDYAFEDPDFKVYDFRSNLVLRWEYIPGSALYIVWSQSRSDDMPNGDFRLVKEFDRIFESGPRNVFLVKLSYRLSI